MKMTKNWKRFWTLDRHHAAGFTLVELIVVIAILAILAGVAVPAYSGYITEANKTADRQLVRDIENALLMGYYQGVIEVGGIVTIDNVGNNIQSIPSAADEASDAAVAIRLALNNAFGNSQDLKLKGEWKGDVAGVYAAFKDSSFNTREDALLKDVQVLTGAVGKFLTTQPDDFMSMIGADGAWDAFSQKHNVNSSDDNEVANATAVFVASGTALLDKDQFVAAWCSSVNSLQPTNFDAVEKMEALDKLAAQYARAEALAGFIDNKNKDGIIWQVNLPDGYSTVSAWFSAQGGIFNEAASTADITTKMVELTSAFEGVIRPSIGTIVTEYNAQGGQGKKDAEAYLAMMGAINDNADKLMEGKGEENLYDGGMASDLLHSYLSAGKALGNVGVEAGKVAVVITIENGRCTVVTLGMTEE